MPAIIASAIPCSTLIERPQSSSTAEAFVKTLKRDYGVVGRPDAVRVLR
jgi:hypothetical protein